MGKDQIWVQWAEIGYRYNGQRSDIGTMRRDQIKVQWAEIRYR